MSEQTSGVSQREKLLIGVLSGVLLIGAYLFIRGSMLDREILVLEDTIQSTQKKIDKQSKRQSKPLTMPKYQGRKIKQRDIDKLAKQIAEENSRLSGFGHVFIDLRDNASLPKLLGEITQRAQFNNLHILSKRQHQGDLVQMVTSKTKTSKKKKNNKTIVATSPPTNSELKRPLYDLRLQGGYAALHGFMIDLGRLGYSVVLTRLRINSTERTALGGGRVLDIEMTLAL
ncbi:MAG: hypothetical protein PSN44_04305 [Gammaproteobacteria bacterium]|nr:hypothetical protein [Gammaproteobacteria bacterium]